MMKKNHAAKRGWRVLALALCLAMLVGLLPTVALAAAGGDTWNDGSTVDSALTRNGGTENDPYTITVNGTVTMNESLTISSGYVRITGGGTLVRGYTGYNMITVKSGATLILDDITVDGNNVAAPNYCGINVSGTLLMNEGTVLEKHNSDSSSTLSDHGSAVRVNSNGKVVMNGGEIRNCVARNYGNIFIDTNGSFTMKGGKISSNSLTLSGNYGGGAFYVRGTLSIDGGSICNHVNIPSYGGAIYCTSEGTVHLNGGTIERNSVIAAKTGDAIFYSSRSGSSAALYIGGNPLITDSIYLDNTRTDKFPYITSTIKNQLTLEVASYSEGRVIAQGTDGYQLTTKDLAKVTLMAGGTKYYAKLEGNQLLMTNKDPGYTVLYNVSYYGNGAAGETLDNTNYASGDTATILDSSFSYPGYEFTGWNTQADGKGTAYSADDEVEMTDDLVLYAQWEKLPQDKVLKIGGEDGVLLSAGEYLASNGTAASQTQPEGGYAYLDTNGTLTLHDFVLDAGSIRVQSAYEQNTLTIKLEGKNVLSSGVLSTQDASSAHPVNLTITGTGSLSVENTGGLTSIYVKQGDIAINGGAQVTLKHNSSGAGETVHAVSGGINVSGTGTTLYAVNTGSYGVKTTTGASGGVTVDDNAKVYISGSSAALAGGELTATLANVQVSNDGKTFAAAKELGEAKTYKCVQINAAPILSYTVTWNANEGTFSDGTTKSEDLTYGTTITAPTTNPTRSGYEFKGWTAVKDGTTLIDNFGTVTNDVTYYAQWKEAEQKTFTITWDANGGQFSDSSVTKTSTDVADGAKIIGYKPTEDPTYHSEGEEFDGWYSSQSYLPHEKLDEDDVIDGESVTYYAKWRTVREVTLNPNGGTLTSFNETIKYYPDEAGVTLPTAANVTKPNYTFAGWYQKDRDTGELTGEAITEIKQGDRNDYDLYAKWEPITYKVTLNTNGGTIADGKDVTSYTYGEGATLPTKDDITMTGYTFVGWYDNAALTGECIDKIGTKASGDKSYWAKWTINKYDITWNLNYEGAPAATTESLDFGAKINAPTDPTRAADAQYTYTFDGWYTATEGGTKVETFGVVTQNVTYYAHWTATPQIYTVTLNTNGGTINADDVKKYTYGEGATLPTDVTKTGYTFDGWYDNEKCEGTAVTEIGKTETGNKTFYLKWTPNTDTPYTVVHGLQSLTDENTYEVKETENLTGTTDTTVTPAVKSYDGFTAPTPQTIKIGADGKTMLRYEYTRNSYKLTYEWTAADGTKHTETESVKYEQKVTPKTMPEVTGYTFSGWSAGEFTMPYHDVKLTGEYTANTYKITYLGMDKATHGTYHPDTHTYDTDTVISNPARKDYRFLGWSINGSSRTYTDLTLGAKDYTADITLTAVWQLDIDPKYDVKLPTTGKGDVSARPDPAGEADAVIITVEPDDGYVVKDVEVVDKDGNRLPVRDLGDNRFSFIMPKSDVTVNVTYTERRGFDDVFVRDYYYDAVNWAVENGITEGVGNNLFAPAELCTRAQVVTFLWRSAGCPKAVSRVNPFTDVSRSAYYYEAVLWAVENGITEGMSATTFEPDAVCTRAQVVTFLYRMFRENAATGSTGFNDVPDGAWYAEAVKWAVDNGITTGVGNNLFAPNDKCTRGQIVTFLWRAYTQR